MNTPLLSLAVSIDRGGTTNGRITFDCRSGAVLDFAQPQFWPQRSGVFQFEKTRLIPGFPFPPALPRDAPRGRGVFCPDAIDRLNLRRHNTATSDYVATI